MHSGTDKSAWLAAQISSQPQFSFFKYKKGGKGVIEAMFKIMPDYALCCETPCGVAGLIWR